MWGDRLAAHRLAARRHLRALEAEQRAERVVLERLQPGERELGAAHQARVVAEHRLARGRGRVMLGLGWRVVAEHRLQLDVAALGARRAYRAEELRGGLHLLDRGEQLLARLVGAAARHELREQRQLVAEGGQLLDQTLLARGGARARARARVGG